MHVHRQHASTSGIPSCTHDASGGKGNPDVLRTFSERNCSVQAAKFALLDAVHSNSSMASALATYQVLTGSWRNILEDLSIIDGLTATDIQSLAAETFDPSNCFTGYVRPLKA